MKRTKVVCVAVSGSTDVTRRSRAVLLGSSATTSRESPTLTVPTSPVRRTLAVALSAVAAAGAVSRGVMTFQLARAVIGATVSKVAGCAPGSGTVWALVPVASAIKAGDPLGGLLGPGGSGSGVSIVKDSAVPAATPGRIL